MPKVACIDLERGSALYGDRYDFHRIESNNLDDLRRIISFLASKNHQYETLLIDPLTIIWELYQAPYDEFSPAVWSHIKQQYKKFLDFLLDLDMHVVCTARSKAKYKPGVFMAYEGETFDADRSTEYVFDTIIKFYRSDEDKFYYFCSKDRTGKIPPGRQERKQGDIVNRLLRERVKK